MKYLLILALAVFSLLLCAACSKGDFGEKGLRGEQGIQDENGEQDTVGATGATGTAGAAGATGATGAPGAAISRTIPKNNTITSLDTTGGVGEYSSATIGSDGLGLISYYDDTNGDLKVAHCENTFCVPYFRRR